MHLKYHLLLVLGEMRRKKFWAGMFFTSSAIPFIGFNNLFEKIPTDKGNSHTAAKVRRRILNTLFWVRLLCCFKIILPLSLRGLITLHQPELNLPEHGIL
jgi:hypothetical protein